MSIELPIVRLGLLGFSNDQTSRVNHVLSRAPSGRMLWQLGKFADADGWWINGTKTQLMPDDTLRVAPGIASGRTVHLDPKEVDRPVAFSIPLAPKDFDPTCRFDLQAPDTMVNALAQFEAWLRPLAAKFSLASHIIEHESVLSSGVHHVTANGILVAVVDLQGEVGVLPAAGPMDFEDAMWTPGTAGATEIPASFSRTSLSQLMWQYAIRTSRDMLPPRYRTAMLYFRRPPRLPQRLLKDSHLLLMRELAGASGSFSDLQQRTGLAESQMAQDLAALYLVGAVTANPKRAGTGWGRRRDAGDSGADLHSVQPVGAQAQADAFAAGGRPRFSDLTAPAPMSLE